MHNKKEITKNSCKKKREQNETCTHKKNKKNTQKT
jgi:hypothetical protein